MMSHSLFQRRRFLEQTNTLVKTLMFFSSRPLSFYILTNDDTVFVDIRDAAAQYNSSQLARCGLSSDFFLDVLRCFKVRFRFYSVEVIYPPGLEEMIGAFKFCATARLFLQVCILHTCLKGHSRITFRVILTIKSL